MTSRAVHLEVAHSLTIDSCINAIRRFLCHRGLSQHIKSDHGTTLVGAERELRETLQALDQRKIHQSLMKEGVQWSFNPPIASHHGGFWEPFIRIVRHVLCSILKQQILDDEGLTTVFCESEAILNRQPITRVSDYPQDLQALQALQSLICTTEDAGDKSSMWQSYTRRDGYWNTSLSSRKDKSGQKPEKTSR